MKRAIFATLTAFAAAAALVTAGAGAANATATVIYDATEAAPNVPSIGFEATSTSEFGDEVTFAGTARRLNTVAVQMSSWACQSRNGNICSSPDGSLRGNVPITLNIYGASQPGPNGTVVPGALIKTVTQTFAIPYRPSTNLNKCPGGGWFKSGKCYNGKAFTITFNLKKFKVNLPDTAVFGVAYNTTHYGYNPVGTSAPCYSTAAGCFYDSLNVGLGTNGVVTGSKPNPATAFANSSWSGFYCDSTPAVGVFNLDSPTSACWHGDDDPMTATDESYSYDPAIRVTAI